jgi:hypothetical protein
LYIFHAYILFAVYITYIHTYNGNWVSAVKKVTAYELDNEGVRQEWTRIFTSHFVQTGSGALPASYATMLGELFTRG